MTNSTTLENKYFEYWNFDIPKGTFVLSNGQIVDPSRAFQEKFTRYGLPDGSEVVIDNTQELNKSYHINNMIF